MSDKNPAVKIVSWNINGIKSLASTYSGIAGLLNNLNADVVCFQETKLPELSDSSLCIIPNYTSYFSTCRNHKAYSGTATFVHNRVLTLGAQSTLSGRFFPCGDEVFVSTEEELGIEDSELRILESEGRCVMTDHGWFVLINIYCPFAYSMDSKVAKQDAVPADRFDFKMRFNYLLSTCVNLLQRRGRHVIVVGDFNVAACRIDHCQPGENFESRPAGIWMDGLLSGRDLWNETEEEEHEANSSPSSHAITHDDTAPEQLEKDVSCHRSRLVDSFRAMHPQRREAYTCWDQLTSARKTNYGTRIDYILISATLLDPCPSAGSVEGSKKGSQVSLVEADIMPEMQGSDHCPCTITLSITMPAGGHPLHKETHVATVSTLPHNYPRLCTLFLFSGAQEGGICVTSRQSEIKGYFGKPGMSSYASTRPLIRPAVALDESDVAIMPNTGSSTMLAPISHDPQQSRIISNVSNVISNGKGGLKKRKITLDSFYSPRQYNKSASSSLIADVYQDLSDVVPKCWSCRVCTYSNELVSPAGTMSRTSWECGMCGSKTPSSAMEFNCADVPIASTAPSTIHNVDQCEVVDQGGLYSSGNGEYYNPSTSSGDDTLKHAEMPVEYMHHDISAESAASEGVPCFVDSHPKNAFAVLTKASRAPPPPPVCTGHGTPSILRVVVKQGENRGKRLPVGKPGNPLARCKFFKWFDDER